MASKFYVPEFNNQSCITLDNLQSGYIRVYSKVPTLNTTVNYRDYFIDYDYIYRDGSQTFGNYTISVNCQNHDRFTTSEVYRVDYVNSLFIFMIITVVIITLIKPIINALKGVIR